MVYEPLHRDVYLFLARLSQRSVLQFDDQIRPLSRKYIAEKLIEAAEKINLLSSLEKEELDFYKSDFKRELDLLNNIENDSASISIAGYDEGNRLRLFSYRDKLFTLKISPILGYKIGSRDDAKLTHTWNGIYAYGYIDKYLGFSFDFRDNSENGKTIDKSKLFTPVTGVDARTDGNIVNYSSNKMEYSDVKATISTIS